MAGSPQSAGTLHQCSDLRRKRVKRHDFLHRGGDNDHGQAGECSSATEQKTGCPMPAPQSGICRSVLMDAPAVRGRQVVLRGREVIYPLPFGKVTAGATKQYPVDYGHLNIQGTCVGRVWRSGGPGQGCVPGGVTKTELGHKHKIKLDVPIFTGALGSTDMPRTMGGARHRPRPYRGIMVVIGENVVGMDTQAEMKNGAVVSSPELKRRVKCFQNGSPRTGEIILQQNVETRGCGRPRYAIEKLGVNCIELKWGRPKDIAAR